MSKSDCRSRGPVWYHPTTFSLAVAGIKLTVGQRVMMACERKRSIRGVHARTRAPFTLLYMSNMFSR